MSGIPNHTDLHPSRNIYLTSWFILSVLFLTGVQTSVVTTCVWDPPSHGPPPWQECLPDQLVHSVCVVFDRQWDITRTSTLAWMSTCPADSFCLCCFWQAIRCCGPYTCPGSPITRTFILVETSTWPACSFCLCCFLTDHETSVVPTSVWDPSSQGLHPGRNIYLTSWVILSVLFLTGGKTSVVPTHVRDPPSHGPPP